MFLLAVLFVFTIFCMTCNIIIVL